MYTHHKLLCAILSVIMLASMVSCSEKNQTSDETAPGLDSQSDIAADESDTETVEEQLKPNIPESADYGDDEIRFLYWTHPEWTQTVRESRDIYSDGLNGEGINDAVYNRNIKIEDAYKVKIILEKMNYASIAGSIQKNIR